ncbi:MAG: hypothetical protein A2Z06_02430 [Candidatus Glassbacteria bacterium RBG_16_58_8]|uniref:RCK C-terminal domain-containing protein n=1 Tax=Candidatus Glassbacteria bacterium RBG_16_58_8 TaxID=1817866 RepID=A0A1F5YDS7_9BACT|nr:MAG: hypothetical protein A2Z06_02430 [Candidatus Glassbacteria bacterium RBG_16_58_8]
MMLITPLLGAESGFQALPVAFSLGKALLLIGVVLTLAIFIIPRLLEVIVRARLREILMLGGVIIIIGTAWLTSWLGLSLALGAFIAGLAISESPYRHQLFAEILPFKDVFNSLFFISVGMLLDLRFLGNHLLPVLLLGLGILLAKGLLGGLAVKLLSGSTRMALLVGVAISQIGEFSFVLARFGQDFRLLDADLYQGFLAITVLTMLFAPRLMAAAPHLAGRIPERLDSRLARDRGKTASEILATTGNHTIIVGFGLNGRYLARVLKSSSIPYCILELNPRTVREAQKEGEPICFGDASRLEILQMVNLSGARVLVITVTELPITRRIISVARLNHPRLHIIARTKFTMDVDELYRIGADQVIAEEFETATEIFARVLAEYDLPRNFIAAYIDTIRREGSPMLRQPQLPAVSVEKLRQLLAGSIVQNFLLLEDSPAAGKTLAQLDLRKRTGATIIAIVHNDRSTANPPADSVLTVGDLLVMMGTHRAMDSVEELLSPK